MFKDVQVVDDSSHVEVSVLVGELDSGITDITTLWIVVVTATG